MSNKYPCKLESISKSQDVQLHDENVHVQFSEEQVAMLNNFFNSLSESFVLSMAIGAQDLIQERDSLLCLNDVALDEMSLLLNEELPSGSKVGASSLNEDGFYDAVAQALNKIKTGSVYDVKSLRLLCHEYIVRNDQAMRICLASNFIRDAFSGDDAAYYEYFGNVRFDSVERQAGEGLGGVGPATFGCAHIDGRILCDALNIKIHLIESVNFDGHDHLHHTLVTHEGVFDVEKVDYSQGNVIHLIADGGWFAPVVIPEQKAQLLSSVAQWSSSPFLHREDREPVSQNEAENFSL